MQTQIDELLLQLEESGISVKRQEPIAQYTTMAVGGPARLLIEIDSSLKLKNALSAAQKLDFPCLVIGKGSNLIFSDEGYEGLMIVNNSSGYELIDQSRVISTFSESQARYEKTQAPVPRIDEYLKKISVSGNVNVRIDSGWRVAALSKKLYKEDIVGLEWFAGIPATVGGGIYMNMHGGPLFFGDLVQRVTVFDGRKERVIGHDELNFAYDYSVLHETRETIVNAEMRLWKGDVNAAADFAREWAKEKAFQPRHSAGCIFQNISENEKTRLNLPTSSTGYVIDHLLGLKEKKIGGAVISHHHAAFIENSGQASAQDVYDLVHLILGEAREKLELELKLEIQFIGSFKQE